MTFLLILLAALLIASPAAADPASLIIAGLGGTASVGVIGGAFIRIGVAVALSALSQALVANHNQRPTGGGVRTQTLTAGDTTPQSFILGRYMTAGNLVAPEMSHGVNGDTRYLTRVVDLGDRAIEALESLIVDGRPVLLDGPVHPTFGRGVLQADYEGILWCKHYLGNQTTADSYLTSVYGSYPERPWQADMIGRAVPYAILTFLWRDSPQTWQGRPVVTFVCKGIRLYDPRKDGSAGGTGAHRFGTASTHEWTDNPVVMIYNILRGITLPGGFTFGGGVAAEDLPFATWAAAMNSCDQVVGSRKRYIAGYEVKIGTPDVGGDSPLDVIDELLKACSGQIADLGGTMLIRVGGPGLPVRFITDDDILRSSAQELDPFPPLEASHTGVHATFPRPAELWQAREAPPVHDAAAEARDGQRLIADLQLPAVPNAAQVQQLMHAWLKDDQRHRRHRIVLPPEGILIEPLSVIDWTSHRNGYSGKAFEVGEVGIDPATLSTTLSLREVDPADYDWTTGQEITLTPPSLVPVLPGPRAVPDWSVAGVAIPDAGGLPRLPALRLGWSAPLPGVSAIRWQVRVAATGDIVAAGTTQNVDQGSHVVSEGIVRDVTYEARGRMVGPRATRWTAWDSATAPNVTVISGDVIQHGGDATAEINARLELLAAAGGGTLRIQRARIGDPVRIDGRVQLRGDDCTLVFDSPVLMGPTGSLRIKGDLDEYWRGEIDPVTGLRVENTGAIPAVSVDTTDDPATGHLVIRFSAASGFVAQFQPGDMVVIRGFISPTRLAAIEKQTAFVATVDAADHRLVLDRPRGVLTRAEDAAEMGAALGDPFAFRYRYYPPGEPETPGTEIQSPTGEGAMSTRIKVLRASRLPADRPAGGHRVTVMDASGFNAGDLIYLSDDRREVDINPARNFLNLVNMEILTIVAVEGDDLVVEAPVRRTYLTAFAARATRMAPVRRSHIRVGAMRWGGMQLTRQFHAMQVDYGAQCTLTAGLIDGRGGRTAQAMRISNSHDCHALGGLIEGAAGLGSGEGYGAALYYSTACSVRNLRISGQRHSILFQGTTFCAAVANSSTDDLITAIDTHGTACIGTAILFNTIRGGTRLTADATRHTGIRIGNSSHVIPDRETLVFGNRIEGYAGPDDAAMDVVPPSTDVLFAANEVIACTRGLRASGLNPQNAREVMAGIEARDNRFLRCETGIEFLSNPLMGIRDVTLIANSFTACRQPVRARGFEAGGAFTAQANLAVDPVDAALPMFDLEDIAAVTVAGGNLAPALEQAVQLRDCPGARVTGNAFGACARAVLRLGSNPGAITGDNGVTGSPTGARIERIASSLPMPLELTAVIPHNNSTPSQADGTSVLAATIPTRPGEGLMIEAVLPYVQLAGTTGPVTAHLFANGAAIASTTERITTGGSSGSPIRLIARRIATGMTLALDLRLGPSTAGPTLTLGAKFDGGADPYLVLHRDPA